MFQKTIISKYLKTQNKDLLLTQWNLFTAHFYNITIQENIRNAKEEQYQKGFLRDLFVNVLGYTLNPTSGFNLTTEYKNIKDSKKTDGAIIIEDKVVAVIELKGTNTTDLGKIEEQAFKYKYNQTGCTNVITSNFEKLRLYIDDSVRFTEFKLFNLKQNDFNLLYLLLAFKNIKNNISKKIKEESLKEDALQTITAAANHQDHQHTPEECTVFCSCSCCPASVIFQPLTKLQFERQSHGAQKIPLQNVSFLSQEFSSLWQPPKIS